MSKYKDRLTMLHPAATCVLKLHNHQVVPVCVSNSLMQFTGYDKEEVIDQPSWWVDNIHPHDKPFVLGRLLSVKSSGYARSEFRFKHKNGQYIDIFDEIKLLKANKTPAQELLHIWWDGKTHKSLENMLWRDDAAFRVLFWENPLPMWLHDLDKLHFLEVNDAAVRKYGYSRAEFMAMHISDIRPESEMKRLMDVIESTHTTRRHTGEWQHRLKNGEIIDVDIIAHRVCFEYTDAMLVLAHDISECKNIERSLRHATHFQETVMAATRDAIYVLDLEGRVTYVNRQACENTGYAREELLGQHYTMLVEAAQRPALEDIFHKTLAHGGTEQSAELNIHRRDGSCHRISLCSTPLTENGRVTGLVATAYDLTSQRQAEAALQTSEEQFRLLVDNVPHYAIFMLDTQGNITLWNQGAEIMFGYASEEILHRHLSVLSAFRNKQRQRAEKELHDALENGAAMAEIKLKRKDGSTFWAMDTIRPIFDERGQLRHYAKIVHDISERKKLEHKIMRLNAQLEKQVQHRTSELKAATNELENFSYSVSHDLRAPLRAIDGFSLALLEDYADQVDAEGKNYLERVRAATQRMSQLIDDQLNLSRVTRKEMVRSRVNLSQIAEEIAAHYRENLVERSVCFTIQPDLICMGDRDLLNIVLENLLNNACKFTRKTPRAIIEFGLLKIHDKSVYYVKDNGVGFNMKYADKLFGAFQRLHGMHEFEGTGIGLVTAQHIIHRHGGEIWAESEENKGATFYFTLHA